MGHAEIIPLDDIGTNHHRRQLRQILHECFDRWLDTLESDLDDTAMTLSDLTTTIWQLRQALMGQLTQTIIQHLYAAEADSCQSLCSTC
jgi:hypothetical protein